MIRHPRFGEGVDPQTNQIETLLQTVDFKLGNIESSILLRQAYDETYQIYDHLNSPANVPFALSMPQPKEDVLATSQFGYYSRRYKDYSVGKYFQLNLLEFLSLPRYEAEVLLKLCQESKKADNQVVANLESELGLNKQR